MVGHRVRRRGCVRIQAFSHAIAKLQGMGYVTELWVSKKGAFALRWIKKSEQWSVTGAGIKNQQEQFEHMGLNVVMWATNIERGLGKERNYAVREV